MAIYDSLVLYSIPTMNRYNQGEIARTELIVTFPADCLNLYAASKSERLI